jgi:Fic family protein
MAGIAHLWFIMIHLFDDGNGRIGRAVTDFVLARSYPSLMELVSFSKYISLDRKGYYSIFEAAGKNGLDITSWLKWFLQTFEAALQESQWIVERVVTKARFCQQNRNVTLNARQRKVIQIQPIDTAIILGFGFETDGAGHIQPGESNQFLLQWTLDHASADTLLVQEGVWAAACEYITF